VAARDRSFWIQRTRPKRGAKLLCHNSNGRATLAAMTDPLDTFQLPSELSALLSLADQAKVLATIREIHVRLAERDPELEDNRGHGHHLWFVYDAIAEPLKNKDNFRNHLAPEFIPKMIRQIRRGLSWYPHGHEDLTYFLAPRILRWQHAVPVHEIQPSSHPLQSRVSHAPSIKRGRAKTAIEESNGPEESTRRRGRRRNQGRRDAIHSAIAKHGDEWRDHLSDIFAELDGNDVPLGDFRGREIDLGDGQNAKVWKWTDLDFAQGDQLKQIVDTLRKYTV
jgi:hypothetical protein